MDQTTLALDDPQAEPVPPIPHEVSIDLRDTITLRVDVARLAFRHRNEIQSEWMTKELEEGGYSEAERFEVWLHNFLIDLCDPTPVNQEGIRVIYEDSEIDFRLDRGGRDAVEAGLNPRYAVPASD